MKNLIFSIFIIFSSCGLSDEEKAALTCNYPYKYENRHYLKIPFEVSPNQLKYKVGDTITISSNFTNNIEDINYERSFKIDSILLRPTLTLMMFEDSIYKGKISGPDNIIIDSIFSPKFGVSTFSSINFDNNLYNWVAKIIIRKKGRYIFTIGDQSSNSELEESKTRNSLDFEGNCLFQGFLICNMIEGDAHLEELEPELIYIDKKVTFNNMFSLYDRTGLGVFGSGSYAWELSGTYGFIVE